MFSPYSNSNREGYYPIPMTLGANNQPVLPSSRDCVRGPLYSRNFNERTLPLNVYPNPSSSLNRPDDYQCYRQPGFGGIDSSQYSLRNSYSPYLVSQSPYSRYSNQLPYSHMFDSPAYFGQDGLSRSPDDPNLQILTRNGAILNDSLYPRQSPEMSFSRGYQTPYTRSPSLIPDLRSSSWRENSFSRSEERSFPSHLSRSSSSSRSQESRNGISDLCYRSLMMNSLYGKLLPSTLSKDSQSFLETLIRDIPMKDAAERVTRQCIHFKKQCTVNKSRLLFIHYLLKCPQQTQTWLEFARMEMEAGCYDNALCVINTALIAIPDHILLLTKKLRILEKLTDVEGIYDLVQRLRRINSQRAVKVTVDAAQVLAKLGEERSSWALLCEVGSNPATYSGWLFLEVLKYCQVMCPFEVTNRIVLDILNHSPKHGPLWSLSLELIEHSSLLCYPFPPQDSYVVDSVYNEISRLAHQVLPADILWKVYFARIFHDTRLLNYFRCRAFYVIDPPEYEEHIRFLQLQLFKDVETTLRICPSALHWKVYMTLGRDAVVTSYRKAARLIMQRGIRNCPLKYQHYLLLEYSKIEFFAGNADISAQLLSTGIMYFPEEWKLSLEYINQLVGCVLLW